MVNPSQLMPPSGFSHAVVAAPGRTVFLGGQTGHRADGSLAGPSLVEQMDQALANVRVALEAAGARPSDLVSIQLFVTDAGEYRANLPEAGRLWRSHLGPHYPAVALFQVQALFDPDARIEIVCIAVIPQGDSG